MYKYSMHLHVRLSNPCCFSVQNKGSQAAVLISKVPPSYLGAWISLRRKKMPPEATLICCSLPSSFQNFQGCENPWGMFFDFKENHGKHTLVLTQVLATSFPFFRSLEPIPLLNQLFGPNKQGVMSPEHVKINLCIPPYWMLFSKKATTNWE